MTNTDPISDPWSSVLHQLDADIELTANERDRAADRHDWALALRFTEYRRGLRRARELITEHATEQ